MRKVFYYIHRCEMKIGCQSRHNWCKVATYLLSPVVMTTEWSNTIQHVTSINFLLDRLVVDVDVLLLCCGGDCGVSVVLLL